MTREWQHLQHFQYIVNIFPIYYLLSMSFMFVLSSLLVTSSRVLRTFVCFSLSLAIHKSGCCAIDHFRLEEDCFGISCLEWTPLLCLKLLPWNWAVADSRAGHARSRVIYFHSSVLKFTATLLKKERSQETAAEETV